MIKIEQIDWPNEGRISETASIIHENIEDILQTEHNYLVLARNPEYDARN